MSNCPECVREPTVARAVAYCHLRPPQPLPLENALLLTALISPGVHRKLTVCSQIYYTHIGPIFPREATEHCAFKSLKNGGERRKGKQEVSVCAFSVQQRLCQELNRVFSYLILQCGGGDFRNGKTMAQKAQVTCLFSERLSSRFSISSQACLALCYTTLPRG